MKYDQSFQRFFLKNPTPMWVYDLETLRFLAVNQAAINQYGYSQEDFLAMTLKDIRPPEDIPALLEEISHLDGELDYAGTWRHIKKSGEQLFVEITSHPMEFQGHWGELVMALDVSERIRKENALRHRLAVESVITEISSRLIGTQDIDSTIEYALERTGQQSKSDRAYLFLFRDKLQLMDNTHEWCAEGVSREIENLQGLKLSDFQWLIAQVNSGEILPIHDVSAMPEAAAAEQEILRSQGIKSLILVPVYIAGAVMGFLGLDNVKETGSWDKEDLALLRLTAQIIGGALTRQRAELALRDSEARFRRLVEGLPGIFYTYSESSGASYWSPQVLQILGLTQEQVESSPFLWNESIHPHDRRACQCSDQRVQIG